MSRFAVSALWAAAGFGATFGVIDIYGHPVSVTESSMQPTLNPNWNTRFAKNYRFWEHDYVFASRWKVRNFEFERGDVVLFIDPEKPERALIKRIIALPGDRVATPNYRQASAVDVPPGHFWVEGDNTRSSRSDSNDFGPLPQGLAFALATHIIWPPSRWGRRIERVTTTDRIVSSGKVQIPPNASDPFAYVLDCARRQEEANNRAYEQLISSSSNGSGTAGNTNTDLNVYP